MFLVLHQSSYLDVEALDPSFSLNPGSLIVSQFLIESEFVFVNFIMYETLFPNIFDSIFILNHVCILFADRKFFFQIENCKKKNASFLNL